MDAQDGSEGLGRDEVQDLGNGFLVCVISEYHPLNLPVWHEVTDASDDALGICLVHGHQLHPRHHWEVVEVIFLVGIFDGHFVWGPHQDDRNANARVAFLGMGPTPCCREDCQHQPKPWRVALHPGPHLRLLHSLSEEEEKKERGDLRERESD